MRSCPTLLRFHLTQLVFFGAATRTKNPDDEDQLLAKTLPASEKVLEVEAVGEANRMMGVTFF